MYSHPRLVQQHRAALAPVYSMPQRVAVLYASYGSNYRALPGVDVFDLARDARTFSGGCPVVAHPPCRLWGRLAHFARSRDVQAELDLAHHALDAVRTNGGVLEHPTDSKLVRGSLPEPGRRDAWGGFVLHVMQSWWGHRAPKPTALYVCGIEPCELPGMPFALGIPEGRIERMGRQERERTPVELASWLVRVARLTRPWGAP